MALVVLGVAWVGSGLATAFWLRRRGHDLLSWAALGFVFGPLLIPLARLSAESESTDRSWQLEFGAPLSGDIAVLVGVDGSPESLHALEQTVSLFGGRLRRLTLATVVDFETADEIGRGTVESTRREHVQQILREASAAAAPMVPETVILSGRPDVALRAAAADGYDVIVIGPRGHGHTEALFGSAATALSRGAPVPVLIVSPAAHRSVLAAAG